KWRSRRWKNRYPTHRRSDWIFDPADLLYQLYQLGHRQGKCAWKGNRHPKSNRCGQIRPDEAIFDRVWVGINGLTPPYPFGDCLAHPLVQLLPGIAAILRCLPTGFLDTEHRHLVAYPAAFLFVPLLLLVRPA